MLLFLFQSTTFTTTKHLFCNSFSLTTTLRHIQTTKSTTRTIQLLQQRQLLNRRLLSTKMTLGQTFPNKETTTTQSTATAKLIPSTPTSIQKAGQRIREGHLVSFPTETVYGLGCHALDPNAVQKVFQAKERPLTDPLIVHVNDCNSALHLWDASSSSSSSSDNIQTQALKALINQFWPGPLTIVAKASSKVPSIIMANTGFVACRSPSHPIAQALIDTSQVPIAAPSANKFGHVSPTKASHVYDDLGMEDVWIVDPSLNDNSNDHNEEQNDNETEQSNVIVCDVGVESTVAKVEFNNDTQEGIITVLRHGAISKQDIRICLENANLGEKIKVQSKQQATGDDINHVAPGQTIRHYSPNVQSYMVSHERHCNDTEDGQTTNKERLLLSEEELEIVKKAVVIDFGGRLKFLQEHALAYRDLSPTGDSDMAASKVFDTLRWSESIDGAQRVYFPELNVSANDDNDDALVLAVKDRLTRAASGVVISTLI